MLCIQLYWQKNKPSIPESVKKAQQYFTKIYKECSWILNFWKYDKKQSNICLLQKTELKKFGFLGKIILFICLIYDINVMFCNNGILAREEDGSFALRPDIWTVMDIHNFPTWYIHVHNSTIVCEYTYIISISYMLYNIHVHNSTIVWEHTYI